MKRKIFMLLICTILCFTFGCEKTENTEKINNDTTTDKSKEINYEERFNEFVESLDTSKFNKDKFSGVIYKEGEKLNVQQEVNSLGYSDIGLVGDGETYAKYSLIKNSKKWHFSEDQNGHYDEYVGPNIQTMIDTLGQPSSVCSYGKYSAKRAILLVYDYGDYDIVSEIIDYTEPNTFADNTQSSLLLQNLRIHKKGNKYGYYFSYGIDQYSCTGKEISTDYSSTY